MIMKRVLMKSLGLVVLLAFVSRGTVVEASSTTVDYRNDHESSSSLRSLSSGSSVEDRSSSWQRRQLSLAHPVASTDETKTDDDTSTSTSKQTSSSSGGGSIASRTSSVGKPSDSDNTAPAASPTTSSTSTSTSSQSKTSSGTTSTSSSTSGGTTSSSSSSGSSMASSSKSTSASSIQINSTSSQSASPKTDSTSTSTNSTSTTTTSSTTPTTQNDPGTHGYQPAYPTEYHPPDDDTSNSQKYVITHPLNPVVDDISQFLDDDSYKNNATVSLFPKEKDEPDMWPAIVAVIFLVSAAVLCATTAYKNYRKRKNYQQIPTSLDV